MRKVIFLVALAVSFTFSMNAQIQMNNGGAVSIGNGPTQSGVLLNIWGGYAGVKINMSESSGFNIKPSYIDECYEPSLFGSNNCGYLGTPTNQLYGVCTHQLFVDGVIKMSSDQRIKKNIRDIDSSLLKIKDIRCVKYDKIINDNDSLSFNKKKQLEQNGTRKIGFLAQDLMKYYPELVSYEKANDMYYVDYIGMIPVLVNALQEQQKQIENLSKRLKAIEGKKAYEGSNLKSSSNNNEVVQEKVNALYQNAPNPFSQNTTIGFYLAEDVHKALICIYDMNGTQLKCYPLNLTGYSNITINGSELKAGMFMYSLIVDGQLIDTKKMVLTN